MAEATLAKRAHERLRILLFLFLVVQAVDRR